MAGLLAWAADVVGGGAAVENDIDNNVSNSIPIVFTLEQHKYVQELDHKAASLSRSIQDLRLRLPPPDISQRLPHLHAHSLASNAALALQLNAHSSTREQAQQREMALGNENAAYEKAISNCENKILEKVREADLIMKKLEELEQTEKNLKSELEKVQDSSTFFQTGKSNESDVGSRTMLEAGIDDEKSSIQDKIYNKKKELSLMEDTVEELEKRLSSVQDDALRKPTPAQREKMLDKQLHGLIEQLAAKQAQAEGLVGEIHLKELELETLNGLRGRVERNNLETSTARNRFLKGSSDRIYALSDRVVDAYHRLPYYRTESLQRDMLIRSAFVLYILALHILVFIKLSF